MSTRGIVLLIACTWCTALMAQDTSDSVEIAELQKIISIQEAEIKRLADTIDGVIQADGRLAVKNRTVVSANGLWQGLTDGLMGPKGPKGTKGTAGTNGADGKDGKNGNPGAKGDDGPRGQTGTTRGPRGDKGPDGNQGAMNCRNTL